MNRLFEVPTYDTPPKVFMDDETVVRRLNGSLQESVTFFNGLPFDVTMVDRTGQMYIIEHDPAHNRIFGSRVVMLVETNWRSGRATKFRDDNQWGSEGLQDARACAREALAKRASGPQGNHDRVILEYSVDHATLIKAGGSLFSPEMDRIFSLNRPRDSQNPIPYHPYSQEALKLKEQEALARKADDINDTHFKIRIVDNDRAEPATYYVAIGDLTLPVTTVKDPIRKNGLYFYQSNLTYRSSQNPSGSQETYYTLQEAKEKFKIAATADEAQAGGDIASLRKERIAQMSHEADIRKIENAQEKLEAERKERLHAERVRDQEAAREQRMRDINEKKQEAENERNETKARREERTGIFKYILELAKTAFGLVTLIKTLMPLFVKATAAT